MYGGGAAAFQQRQMAAEKEAEMDGKEDSPPKRNSQLNHNRIMPADKVEKDEALPRMSTLDSFYHDVNAHGMLRKAARRRSSMAQKFATDVALHKTKSYGFGRAPPTTRWAKFRRDTCALLNDPTSSLAAQMVSLLMTLLIFGSVTILVLSTVKGYSKDDIDWGPPEAAFTLLFTLELILRVLCQYDKAADILVDGYFYIDLLAVLPWYVEALSLGTVKLPDILSAIRIVRLFKLFRQFQGAITLAAALEQSIAALTVPLFFLAISATTFGVFIYYIEELAAKWELEYDDNGVKVTKAGAFQSIPHAIWFVFVTMTTVGYGDVSPASSLAKFIDIFAMIFGVLFLSMPLAILGNNFCSVWDDRDRVTLISRMRDAISQTGVNRTKVAEAFDQIDLDGSGTVNFREFCFAVQYLNLSLPKKNLQKLWKSIDRDGSGEIQIQEFTDMLFPELEVDSDDANEGKDAGDDASEVGKTIYSIEDLYSRMTEQEARMEEMAKTLNDMMTLLREQQLRPSPALTPLPNMADAAST